MYVSGIASATSDGPMRTWSTRARSLPFFSVAPWRFARISTTSAPTLWRVRAYSSPGLPRPTTSRSAAVPRRRSTGYSSPASSEVSASDASAAPPSPASPSSPSTASPSPSSSVATRGAATCATTKSDSTSVATPVGQRDVLDAELVADGEGLDVDLDRHRDVARHGLDREVEEQLLEQAAVLHALGLADQVDRDLGAHRDVAVDAHEVDVHEHALAWGAGGSGGRA